MALKNRYLLEARGLWSGFARERLCVLSSLFPAQTGPVLAVITERACTYVAIKKPVFMIR